MADGELVTMFGIVGTFEGFNTGFLNKPESGTSTKNSGFYSFRESCSNIFAFLAIKFVTSFGLT